MINLVQLSYFCRVYELLSYSKAAEELYLSRQALRKSIISLENEIYGELFERQDNGLKPKPLAEYLYPEAKKLLGSEEKLLHNLHEFSLHQKQVLRVGATFSALETFHPTLPMEFRAKYPEINLEFTTVPDRRLEELVENDKLDGAFVIGKPANARLFHCISLVSEPLYFVMRPDLTPCRDAIPLDAFTEIPLCRVYNDV